MVGTIVNVAAIILGAAIGLFFGKAFPERLRNILIQAIGLSILIIGLQMALKTNNILIMILSMVLGGLIGEAIGIEAGLNRLGEFFEKKISSRGNDQFSKAFVTTSLIYCVGAMAVVGALEDGLNGNHSILFAKAALDGITAIVFSSSMGIGVAASAFPVLIYQGCIALFAGLLQGVLSDTIILEMSAVGGLLIFGIGITMLGMKEIRVGNLLPAIIFVIPFVILFQYLGIY
ncbi:DUF554 domain-containing protein [Dehalobacter sp. DCM]|uniref:DUF554 domain-containing protein n=1 Tax=Dehalobacter sp. DCM TaxID=2907827 RepID=UPI003081F809|nr:DUF554 domain-containing protein [Dehalobacter sp. DCM]